MSARRQAIVVGVLLALWAVGCRNVPVVGDPPPRLKDGDAERAYRELLDRHTGKGEIYTGFTTQLFAGATYQTWAFREARVRRLAQFKQMSPQEIDALLAAERADWEQFHVFEFGAWTREPRYDDFDRKSSIWRIALSTDGRELLPAEVARVARVDQDARALYPYMGEFWVRYRVRFPRQTADGAATVPAGTRALTLKVASTLGWTELTAAAE